MSGPAELRPFAELGKLLGSEIVGVPPAELLELLDGVDACGELLEAIREAGPFAVPPAVWRAAIRADANRMRPGEPGGLGR